MLNNLKQFNELAEKCGNKYLTAKYLAASARNFGLNPKYHGLILESKLISWALTGIQPYSDKELEKRRRLQVDSDLAEVEDYLCYVDDEEVKEQVRKYYRASIRSKHVVLDESNKLDKYRQMRVNVIVRMMWYGLPDKEGK